MSKKVQSQEKDKNVIDNIDREEETFSSEETFNYEAPSMSMTIEDYEKLDKSKIQFMIFRRNRTDPNIYYYMNPSIEKEDRGKVKLLQSILLDYGANKTDALMRIHPDPLSKTAYDLFLTVIDSILVEISKSFNIEEINLIDYESLDFNKPFNPYSEHLIAFASDEKLSDFKLHMSNNLYENDTQLIQAIMLALSDADNVNEFQPLNIYFSNVALHFIDFTYNLFTSTAMFHSFLEDIKTQISQDKLKQNER